MTVRSLAERVFTTMLLCGIIGVAMLTITGCSLSLHADPAGSQAGDSYLPGRVHPPLTKVQEAFKGWKFGMFIHWGLKSLPPGSQTPAHFSASKFSARAWVQLAKESGMKYITFTAKHDWAQSLALWDNSPLDTWNSVDAAAAHKDFVKLLADECHRQKIPLFLYFPVTDVHYPNAKPGNPAYRAYYLAEMRQLLTQYGNIAGFWFDGGSLIGTYHGQPVADLIHQENGLVMPYDFYVSEKTTTTTTTYDPQGKLLNFPIPPPTPNGWPFEVCDTINNSWFHNSNDKAYKDTTTLLRKLVEIVGKGGNYLLDQGPLGSGAIDPEDATRLRAMGAWLKKNGAALYDTRPGPIPPQSWGYPVQKGKRIFLHVLNWPSGNELILPGLGNDVRRASVLNGKRLPLKRGSEGLAIRLPESARDPIDTIIVLDR
jgi:alpha-L-fucosidase